MFKKLHSHAKSRSCVPSDHIKVEQNLAYTPSQMNELRERGIPISAQSFTSQFYDGDTTGDMSIDPVCTRGFEAIDAWNLEKDSKSRLAKAHLQDKAYFGDGSGQNS